MRTYRRWRKEGRIVADKRPTAKRPTPKNRLTPEEEQLIINVCNSKPYEELPVSQIYPKLLDLNVYIASPSTFYRVLRRHEQMVHRHRAKPGRRHTPPTTYTAHGPNEVYTWDITYCPSQVNGLFYYLYMVMDIYSRKIVGYEVHERESGSYAAELLQRIYLKERIQNKPLVLHSDNGSPMKCYTMKAKMEALNVTPSYNRPRVSDDNPFSESLFKTVKYHPSFPKGGFKSLADARAWSGSFVTWYNHEHQHSKINFVTPNERHEGRDHEILAKRKALLESVKAARPERWSRGIQNLTPAGAVTLNPEKVQRK